MKIDFHTHAFPPALAGKAIPQLAARAQLTPMTDGTLDGLLARMDQYGVDRAVVANIATNPRQERKVNAFAVETLSRARLYPLGSVHPDSENIRAELTELRAHGITGVKLHPDYMEHDVDDDAFAAVFTQLAELDMFALIHAGYDAVSPEHDHAAPEQIARVLDAFPSLTLIAAHMGGTFRWDAVEEHLIGKRLYIDTSLSSSHGLSPEQASRMIEKHGADRVLFASDMPWEPSRASAAYIDALPLSNDEKELIFHKNAEKLLGEHYGNR